MPGKLTLVIMPWGRVGSNLVNNLLSEWHGLQVHNEALTGIRSRSVGLGEAEVAARQRAFLHEIALTAGNTPVVINHAAISASKAADISGWVEEHAPNLISLDRHDDLAVAISTARAEAWVEAGKEISETRNWSVERNVDFLPDVSPIVVRQRMAMIREARISMQELIADRDCLALYYEDLVADIDGCMSAILRRIGIARKPFSVRTRQFGSIFLSEMVSNPEEFGDLIEEEAEATAIRM